MAWASFADDPEVRKMVPTLDRHIVTFGLGADADV